MPGSLTGPCHVSGRPSSDDAVGTLFGVLLLTGSPSLPLSNIEIREFVGAMDNESTTSLPLVLAPPTLVLRRGVLFSGLGLALLLAASVAAMKLGLFGSTLACRKPALPVEVPAPSLVVLPKPWASACATSATALFPVPWGTSPRDGLLDRLAADCVAAVSAPLSL